jgi:hypothetical protein
LEDLYTQLEFFKAAACGSPLPSGAREDPEDVGNGSNGVSEVVDIDGPVKNRGWESSSNSAASSSFTKNSAGSLQSAEGSGASESRGNYGSLFDADDDSLGEYVDLTGFESDVEA